MAQIIIISLYGLMFLFIKMLVPLEMSNGVRLAFNIVGGIGALILPIVIYFLIDVKLTKRAVNIIGRNWCNENKKEFNKVEIYKNHFALIYQEAGKKARKKFRIRFTPTTWFVNFVRYTHSDAQTARARFKGVRFTRR